MISLSSLRLYVNAGFSYIILTNIQPGFLRHLFCFDILSCRERLWEKFQSAKRVGFGDSSEGLSYASETWDLANELGRSSTRPTSSF